MSSPSAPQMRARPLSTSSAPMTNVPSSASREKIKAEAREGWGPLRISKRPGIDSPSTRERDSYLSDSVGMTPPGDRGVSRVGDGEMRRTSSVSPSASFPFKKPLADRYTLSIACLDRATNTSRPTLSSPTLPSSPSPQILTLNPSLPPRPSPPNVTLSDSDSVSAPHRLQLSEAYLLLDRLSPPP
jgi:hypothetical protein